ncbi:alpha/beta fold hydrolase [Microbulbifer sp. SSSA005]|uniref:alpha/beta fold hydrolase n=1 Tax=Microbulbifer sp. SSSA005 TaxID=3243378 RepID=UPI00403A3EE4
MKRRSFLNLSFGLAALLQSKLTAALAESQSSFNFFNSPNFVNVNGIKLAYYEKGEGVPVVFCHGFPELAFTWRHQIETLSINGYRKPLNNSVIPLACRAVHNQGAASQECLDLSRSRNAECESLCKPLRAGLEGHSCCVAALAKGYGHSRRAAPNICSLQDPQRHYGVIQRLHRSIAPDLRGYGLTQSPNNIEDYTAPKICDDLVGLLDHLDLDKAIFCGHDWGGFIVQSMSFLYPERCLGVINIGAPHAFRPEYADELPSETVPVIDKVAFNQFLQTPLTPEKLLNENVEKLFTTFMRSKFFHASYLKSFSTSSAERKMDLPKILKKETLPGKLFLSNEELEFYVRTFQKSGFNGSINWYRAMELSWHELSKKGESYEVEFPYLYLWPNEDPINQLGLSVNMESFIHKLESVELKDCGHFPSEENPEKLSAEILVWLQKTFP